MSMTSFSQTTASRAVLFIVIIILSFFTGVKVYDVSHIQPKAEIVYKEITLKPTKIPSPTITPTPTLPLLPSPVLSFVEDPLPPETKNQNGHMHIYRLASDFNITHFADMYVEDMHNIPVLSHDGIVYYPSNHRVLAWNIFSNKISTTYSTNTRETLFDVHISEDNQILYIAKVDKEAELVDKSQLYKLDELNIQSQISKQIVQARPGLYTGLSFEYAFNEFHIVKSCGGDGGGGGCYFSSVNAKGELAELAHFYGSLLYGSDYVAINKRDNSVFYIQKKNAENEPYIRHLRERNLFSGSDELRLDLTQLFPRQEDYVYRITSSDTASVVLTDSERVIVYNMSERRVIRDSIVPKYEKDQTVLNWYSYFDASSDSIITIEQNKRIHRISMKDSTISSKDIPYDFAGLGNDPQILGMYNGEYYFYTHTR